MQRRIKFLIPLLLVLIVGIIGLNKDRIFQKAQQATVSSPSTQRFISKIVLVYSLRVNQFPAVVALEKGIFDKYNLYVEPVVANSNASSVIASGKADVTLGSPNTTLASAVQGSQLSWVGNINNDQGTLLVSIKDPKYIKKVGVVAGPSQAQTVGMLSLIDANTQNLAYQNLSDANSKLLALQQKQVDAIHIAKPDWIIYKRKNNLSDEFKVLLDSSDNSSVQMPVSIIVRNEFLKSNPKVVEDFTRSLIEANDWIRNNKEEFIKMLQKRYSDIPAEDIQIEGELYFDNIQNVQFEPTMEKGKEMLKLVEASNPQAKEYDLNNFINTSIATSLRNSGVLK